MPLSQASALNGNQTRTHQQAFFFSFLLFSLSLSLFLGVILFGITQPKKRKPEDFIISKRLGQGSYSSVRVQQGKGKSTAAATATAAMKNVDP